MTAALAPVALFNLEAEQGLLGAILFENSTLDRVGPLAGEHFYDPVHGRIFAAVRKVIAEGRVADGVTLKEFFARDGGIAEIGGATYLMRLMDMAAPLSSQAAAYAELIVDLARRRAVAALGADISLNASAGDRDAADIIVDAERKLADLADAHQPFAQWRPIAEVMERAVAAAEAGEALGMPTGLDDLDATTGGLCRGQLWVIAGAPSMGKSLCGQAIALNLARRGYGVGYVHLEMGETSTGLRAATAMAHDPHNRSTHLTDANPTYLGARRQKLSPWAWDRLRAMAQQARGLPLRIDARPHQTLSQIEASAKRLKRLMERAGTPLAALFIDHEGLIAAEKDRKAKWEEVSDRTVRLQALAKRLDVALVALVQINREGAKKDGTQRPTMNDLAKSADIERCADVICLLYREAYYAQRKPIDGLTDEEYWQLRDQRESDKLEIIVDKGRDGARKTVKAILDVRTGYLAEAPG